MQKRGQGEQFNWIFILIAGAIVLTFFIMFTFRYIHLQDQQYNVRVARTMNENIRLLESSGVDDYVLDEDTFTLGTTRTFDYACLDGRTALTINNDYAQEIKGQLLFMPETLTTNAFRAWIRSWNDPYYIGNIILLQDPATQNIIIADATQRQFVEDLRIPRTFPITLLARAETLPTTRNPQRITFITTTPPTTQELSTLASPTTHIVYINPPRQEVTFYINGKATGKQRAPTTLLLGALVTNTFSQYQCLINFSAQHFNDVTTMYQEKAKLLSRVNQPARCDYQPILKTLTTSANTLQMNAQTRTTLLEQNTALQGNGCQPLY